LKNIFEDPSHLRVNPLKEGQVDAEQGTVESPHNPNHEHCTNQVKEAQGNQELVAKIQLCSPFQV